MALRDLGIGSDFESLQADQLVEYRSVPWGAELVPTAYSETGRQALTVVASVLRERKYTEVFVPAHACESMVAPFLAEGFMVRAIPLDEDLHVHPEAARDQFGPKSAVLLAAYFGRNPAESHIALGSAAREAGAFVIEDETHRPFTPGAEWANVRFASLRKVLPVADGAYVQGDSEVITRIDALPDSDSERWAAMDMKALAGTCGHPADSFRPLMARENQRLEDNDRARRMTRRTEDTLGRLPFQRLADIRLDNARTLVAALRRVGVSSLSLGGDDVPSHVVAYVDRPGELQATLATAGVYCPIHWPPVRALFNTQPWRTDLLSIPVDHRYGASDMQYVAKLFEVARVS